MSAVFEERKNLPGRTVHPILECIHLHGAFDSLFLDFIGGENQFVNYFRMSVIHLMSF